MTIPYRPVSPEVAAITRRLRAEREDIERRQYADLLRLREIRIELDKLRPEQVGE